MDPQPRRAMRIWVSRTRFLEWEKQHTNPALRELFLKEAKSEVCLKSKGDVLKHPVRNV